MLIISISISIFISIGFLGTRDRRKDFSGVQVFCVVVLFLASLQEYLKVKCINSFETDITVSYLLFDTSQHNILSIFLDIGSSKHA